ncbi:hypothetical protein MNBD_DELTA02-867 [hydrothermal vent metagenome]|uniref:Tll0287-like domain-containing protein n=1 Tax=hydrothermal vent metagenome TaxID=652676 RepID=A0A3B0VRT1_9ZZZZ
MFSFKRNLALILILALPLIHTAVDAAETGQGPSEFINYKEALKKARLTTDIVVKHYNQALLNKGGIREALIECVKTGQEITSSYSAKTGYIVRRTSLKYRNPLNMPTPDEKRILKGFNRLNHAGKIKPGYENHSIVQKGKVKYLLYMRPLVTKRLCLNCHGGVSDISPDISRIIKKAYPADRATGYAIGDIRGAVSIMVPLEKTH